MADRRLNYDALRKPVGKSSPLSSAGTLSLGVDGTSIPGQRKLFLPPKSNPSAAAPSARLGAPPVALLINSFAAKKLSAAIVPAVLGAFSSSTQPVTGQIFSAPIVSVPENPRAVLAGFVDPKLAAVVEPPKQPAEDLAPAEPGWAERLNPTSARCCSPPAPRAVRRSASLPDAGPRRRAGACDRGGASGLRRWRRR
jgi:hypothetical protein